MAGMPITEERKKLIQFSASYAAVPAYFAVLESSDLAAFQSELERAQLDRIEAVEQAALDALERAFAGRIVGVAGGYSACQLARGIPGRRGRDPQVRHGSSRACPCSSGRRGTSGPLRPLAGLAAP
jgi:ABC-type amino acid transport substrate-binding protein